MTSVFMHAPCMESLPVRGGAADGGVRDALSLGSPYPTCFTAPNRWWYPSTAPSSLATCGCGEAATELPGGRRRLDGTAHDVGPPTSARSRTRRITTLWSNGWSEPVTFTIDTGMQITPEMKALATVNTALDAADVAPATTSDDTYAAIADTGTNTVGVPWGTSDAISVQSTDRGSMAMGLPTAQPRGVALNGNVVYANPDGPVDTVAQPTLEGGARTFQVIKNATAPHEYTSAMQLPAGATLTPFDGDTILVSSGTDENPVTHGLIDAPWARDANGNDVPTSYRIEGSRLIQVVNFTSTTVFPVVADPKLTFGWGIYFNAKGIEWKAYGQAAIAAGWGGWLYGCTVAQASCEDCRYRQDGLRRGGRECLDEPRQVAQADQQLEALTSGVLPDQDRTVQQETDQGQREELQVDGRCTRGALMIVRTPWWLNLIALAAAIVPCIILDLPWYIAAVGALVTGTIADQAWQAVLRRRNHGRG
ncbi:hypothetical protein [Streptomyces sp. NPDC059881]|uniref:hypothetical protein n=1 Tax=Streptomyces sp. NPDC059881 TaxID=3346986 RepID=UPI00365B1BCB